MGSLVRMNEIAEFRDFVAACEVQHMRSSWSFYTWTNKQRGGARVVCKIDWVLNNYDWHL